MVVRGGCTKRVTFLQRYEWREVSYVMIWERPHQAEGIACAKVQSQKHVWCVGETAGVSGREKNMLVS